ncbi:MAG: glycoside hydrolase family 28 protein [Mangrovibacterium sp.]
MNITRLLISVFVLLALHATAQHNPQALEKIPTENEVGQLVCPETIAPIEGAPFEMPQMQRPTFPKRTVVISEKGVKEDKSITTILNKAIADLSKKGGGTVIVPKGKWTCARVMLQSNINLYFEEGAEVLFSDQPEDYLPAVITRHEGVDIWGAGGFIYADGATNIAITGKGLLSGPRIPTSERKTFNSIFEIENELIATPLAERIFDGQQGRTFFAPKFISPINCTDVFIEGVTLENGWFWNINPIYCENVIIRGVSVSSIGIPSGDGIDISSCKNVLIEYSTLNNGDDCFTLKSGRGDDGYNKGIPTENVVIRYCLAQKGHGGITCGSETAASIKNVYAHDCVFVGTRTALRFKTRRSRGGGSEDIFYERMRMIGVGEALTWDLLGTKYFMGDLALRHPMPEVNHLTPVVRNIHVKDFVVESASRFFTMNAIPEMPLKNVLIENGLINCKDIVKTMYDTDGFVMKNLTIKAENRIFNMQDVKNVSIQNVEIK